MLRAIFLSFFICTSALFSEEEDISMISESLGHLIRKNLDSLGVKFDMDLVIKGMKGDQKAPLSEDECVQAISSLQESLIHEKSEVNLKIANEFLSKNRGNQDIIEIEPNKLQYKVLKQGNGQAVKEHDSPLLIYTGRYLDGSVFGFTEEPETVSLEETILGFSKAIIGMKKGEKRIVYIHPDLGYGKSSFVEPNSLLTFEVEVIEANSTLPKLDPYICDTPEKPHEAVR